MAQFVFFGKLGWLPDGQRLPIGASIRRRSITRLYTIDSLLTGDWELSGSPSSTCCMPVVVLAYGSLAV